MELFHAGRPNIYTIPTGVSFADVLAREIDRQVRGDPAATAEFLILVPNRRAVRTLQEAFVRAAKGEPRILPDIQPIGDISDEDLLFEPAFSQAGAELALDPPIPRIRRLLLLARQIRQAAAGLGQSDMPSAGALQLAGELARLLDEMQTHGVSSQALFDLAPERFAKHWQEVLRFLEIITKHWPDILAADGHSDIAVHRNTLISNLAKAWRSHPPRRKVIAAGSTGSRAPTGNLLGVVARLDQGAVVLPGLDLEATDEVWQALNEPHPQFTMKELLERMGVVRGEVRLWPVSRSEAKKLKVSAHRLSLVREALRPAETISGWRDLKPDPKAALKGLVRIECANQRDEAGVIALLLRQALDTHGKTAALVTADRRLARRVGAELERWEIAIDDSAGRPLALTNTGSFFLLVAHSVAENHSPIPLLSLMKHPLAAAGMERSEFLRQTRRLELAALRAPRPGGGLKGVRKALGPAARDRKIGGLLKNLEVALAPLEKLRRRKKVALEDLVVAHVACAEGLAATPSQLGIERLWTGEDGEALAAFVDELGNAAGVFGNLPIEDYAAVVERLMLSHTVRPRFGQHPRLFLWGPLEARLQAVDRLIVGGLNEGTWPPAPDDDPWMSRPMRQEVGLPLPERRIGQSAHDFVQALGADEVYLTRAVKIDGAPSVASRWLLRLEALAGPLPKGPKPWIRWFHELDRPERSLAPAAPRPTPPVEARPQRLSVTGVESWMRDPYSIYAAHILGLKALDPIDQAPGVKARGTIIHKALDRFLRSYDGPWDEGALEALLVVGRQSFSQALTRPGVGAFWWPRFEAAAKAFIELQAARADTFEVVATEVKGRYALKSRTGEFLLTARADRIDRAADDGRLVVIDYKTGALPSDKRIVAGFAPQLPLEALMAERGAFEGIKKCQVEGFEYWQVSGGAPALRIRRPKVDPAKEIARAEAGLKDLVERFAIEETPYLSNPRPRFAGYGDYDHLARVREWRFTSNDGEDQT
jgi:ATP-dependent helicase/nuclease subunit B